MTMSPQEITAGPGNGVDEMVAYLTDALARVVTIQHAISTSRIDLDGDTASAKTVCHSRRGREGGRAHAERSATQFSGVYWRGDGFLVAPQRGR